MRKTTEKRFVCKDLYKKDNKRNLTQIMSTCFFCKSMMATCKYEEDTSVWILQEWI